MNKKISCLLFILLMLVTPKLWGQDLRAQGSYRQDLGTTFKLFTHGFVQQFQTPSNLFYAGLAAPALWYTFREDDRLSDLARSKEMKKSVDFVGEFGVALGFPLFQLGVYEVARRRESTHVMQFMMEYTATVYLAYLESAALSLIPIHERPETSESNFWEKAFRGKSSFPSGHMIPYAALAFKTLQFYGPWWSLPAFALTTMASLQRVQDGKHFTSDVVGSLFLVAFAAEGVRRAGGHPNNHPFYRWAFEREFSMGVTRYEDAIGPRVSFKF